MLLSNGETMRGRIVVEEIYLEDILRALRSNARESFDEMARRFGLNPDPSNDHIIISSFVDALHDRNALSPMDH